MAKRAGKSTAYTFGDLVASASTTASASDLRNSDIKHNGINNLNNRSRCIGAAVDVAYFALAAEAFAA